MYKLLSNTIQALWMQEKTSTAASFKTKSFVLNDIIDG